MEFRCRKSKRRSSRADIRTREESLARASESVNDFGFQDSKKLFAEMGVRAKKEARKDRFSNVSLSNFYLFPTDRTRRIGLTQIPRMIRATRSVSECCMVDYGD